MTLNLQDILIQLPLLVLLIYVIELRDKRWQEMMRERDKQWQSFFEAQEVRHQTASMEIASALRESTKQAVATHQLMMVHDQRVVNALPMMQQAQQSMARGDKE